MITASVVTAIPYVLSLAAVIGTFVGFFTQIGLTSGFKMTGSERGPEAEPGVAQG